MLFAERIAAIRSQMKLSQASFGEMVNVSQRTVAFWESGERMPSNATITDLADTLRVSVDYLLGRTDIPTQLTPDAGHSDPLGPELATAQITTEEKKILIAYRRASGDTRRAVRAVLGVEDQEKDETAAI